VQNCDVMDLPERDQIGAGVCQARLAVGEAPPQMHLGRTHALVQIATVTTPTVATGTAFLPQFAGARMPCMLRRLVPITLRRHWLGAAIDRG
jgi:hypothetical protein